MPYDGRYFQHTTRPKVSMLTKSLCRIELLKAVRKPVTGMDFHIPFVWFGKRTCPFSPPDNGARA